jgi:hypothetical protein
VNAAVALDELFAPEIAAALVKRGHDVLAWLQDRPGGSPATVASPARSSSPSTS